MRASIFRRCKFTGAMLRGADLRRSTFDKGDFTGANLLGAVAEGTVSRARLRTGLSKEQLMAVSWVEDAGPEPPGGSAKIVNKSHLATRAALRFS
jgi:BTB/POZ domain-containing protein KCTD9